VTPEFSATDRATWGETLTLAQVSAIYNRSERGILDACTRRIFQPARFLTHPSRWRKSDVIRHLDGAMSRLRRAS
jgi:hypothetical protein